MGIMINPPPIPARDPRSPAAAPMDMDLKGTKLLSDGVTVGCFDFINSFFFFWPDFGLDDFCRLIVCLPLIVVDLILP